MNNNSIAIFAGKGKITEIAIKKSLKLFDKVLLFDLGIENKNISKYKNLIIYKSHPGLLKKNLNILKKENIKNILFIGKLDKSKIFKEKKFDLTAIRLLLTLKDQSDFSILQKLVDFFESHNINFISQKEFFKEFLMPQGNLTKLKFTKKEFEEAKLGFKICKGVNEYGIGQSIIIENKMVIAVEAIEGTDEMIKRSKRYLNNNAIFIKVAKENHNPKFDLPGFGMRTLKLLFECNIKKVALESDWVLLIEKEKIIKFANEKGMKIIGIK
jgi:DUF1009 family protein